MPRVTLTAASGGRLNGTVVHVYEREEWRPTDAPTIRNLAGEVFANVPAASRVVAD